MPCGQINTSVRLRPLVSFEENKVRPLGPFQELDNSVMGAVKYVK
jgi:hypothetical protein